MVKNFRQGAIGALLDEYEKAILELKKVIEIIPDNFLPVVVDDRTRDENCRTVQAILAHVVNAGYGYAISIHNRNGAGIVRPAKAYHTTIRQYIDEITEVFLFTENVFREVDESEVEQYDNSLKIKTSWGQSYDIEQLAEHAIVHILRHRRQIERFNLKG